MLKGSSNSTVEAIVKVLVSDESEDMLIDVLVVAVTVPVKFCNESRPELWPVRGSVARVMAPVLVKSKVMPPALVTALLKSKLRLKPVLLFAVTVKLTGTVTVTAANPATVLGILHTVPAAHPSRVALELLKK